MEFTQFQLPAFFDIPQLKFLRGMGHDKKENKDLGKEVNHKFSGELSFRGTQFLLRMVALLG